MDHVNDVLDITGKVVPVTVVGVGIGVTTAVQGYTDGRHYFFDDATTARIAAHLAGELDLAGRPVTVERTDSGWSEYRGHQSRTLHLRHVAGQPVYRLDDEWLFTTIAHQRDPEPDH